jgi:hypothetical protein
MMMYDIESATKTKTHSEPFNWFSIPPSPRRTYNESYFLHNMPLGNKCNICVRFSPITVGNVKKVSVHFTGKTGEGYWQPWGAWEGCCLQGNTEEHARNIWNLIMISGEYCIGRPPEWELALTKYKNSQWEPRFYEKDRTV